MMNHIVHYRQKNNWYQLNVPTNPNALLQLSFSFFAIGSLHHWILTEFSSVQINCKCWRCNVVFKWQCIRMAISSVLLYVAWWDVASAVITISSPLSILRQSNFCTHWFLIQSSFSFNMTSRSTEFSCVCSH